MSHKPAAQDFLPRHGPSSFHSDLEAEKRALDRELAEKERQLHSNRMSSFSHNFFGDDLPSTDSVVGEAHTYDWKSKSFNGRQDTDMDSNKRFEVESLVSPEDITKTSQDISSDYLKLR